MNLPFEAKYKLSRYNVSCQKGDVEYIWNTYSDALIELDERSQKYIHTFVGNDDGSDDFNLLKKHGFIVYEQIDEIGRICLQEKQELFTKNPRALTIIIVPGMQCNYSCDYCFEANSDKSGVMTSETALDVATYICQKLSSNPNIQELRIMWFGGEPLLYVNIMETISRKVIAYTQMNNIIYRARITTNGRFLTQDTLTLLKELSIEWAQITVDGTSSSYCKSKGASPEDYKCVIENICNAAGKIGISIRLNIFDSDANEAIAITDYLLKECNLLGKIHIYFTQVCDYLSPQEISRHAYVTYANNYLIWLEHIITHYGTKSVKILTPKQKNTSCGLIRASNTCIGPSGELYRCEHCFGDVSMISGSIYTGRYFNKADLSYYSTINMQSKCSKCEYVPICMGACANDCLRGFVRIDCETYKHIQFELKLMEGGVHK